MKLAMAVGPSRHYRVDEITPRHFLQTAKMCDLSDNAAVSVLDEISDTAPKALDQTLSALPKGFPEKLALSITNGARGRLKMFGQDKRR
jgi:serine/threonine-protein kinase HipA